MTRSMYLGGAAAVALFTFLLGYLVGTYSVLPIEGSIPSHAFEQYVLFTRNTRSDVSFAIMREFERPKFIHSWFPKMNPRRGVPELKNALATLPEGSYVLWESWPPRRFDYPPENAVREVIKFAETNGVHVKESPALQ